MPKMTLTDVSVSDAYHTLLADRGIKAVMVDRRQALINVVCSP